MDREAKRFKESLCLTMLLFLRNSERKIAARSSWNCSRGQLPFTGGWPKPSPKHFMAR